MNTSSKSTKRFGAAIIAAILYGLLTSPESLLAKGGATDPIPGASNSGVKSGGGGGGKAAPAPAPAPAPAAAPTQPLVVAPLTFTAAASVNGVIPQCTGSYRIDPYYPTLSLMTIYATPTSVNVPDGTYLYITVNLAGGTGYPFTSNAIYIAGQAGSATFNEYVTPGATITSVVITDVSGAIVFAGN